MKTRILILICLSLTLLSSGCKTAGQITAEGTKYETIRKADSEAAEASEDLRHKQTINGLNEFEAETITRERIEAKKEILWYATYSSIALLIGAAVALIIWWGGAAIFSVRVSRAGAIRAERNAQFATFALDAKTRQYPLVASPSGKFLILPGAGLSIDLSQARDPDKLLSAGMNYTQAAGAIAQEARLSKNSNSAGVAGVNPLMLNTSK